MEAVNVVTAGLVEDQPSPMHTKEFQTLSEFQSVNLDHETGNLFRGIVNSFINIYFFFNLKKSTKMFVIGIWIPSKTFQWLLGHLQKSLVSIQKNFFWRNHL